MTSLLLTIDQRNRKSAPKLLVTLNSFPTDIKKPDINQAIKLVKSNHQDIN